VNKQRHLRSPLEASSQLQKNVIVVVGWITPSLWLSTCIIRLCSWYIQKGALIFCSTWELSEKMESREDYDTVARSMAPSSKKPGRTMGHVTFKFVYDRTFETENLTPIIFRTTSVVRRFFKRRFCGAKRRLSKVKNFKCRWHGPMMMMGMTTLPHQSFSLFLFPTVPPLRLRVMTSESDSG
jgi:hypothetical protein